MRRSRRQITAALNAITIVLEGCDASAREIDVHRMDAARDALAWVLGGSNGKGEFGRKIGTIHRQLKRRANYFAWLPSPHLPMPDDRSTNVAQSPPTVDLPKTPPRAAVPPCNGNGHHNGHAPALNKVEGKRIGASRTK